MSRSLSAFCLAVAVTVANASDGWQPKRLNHGGLPNAFQLHSRVLSGGTPEGEAGFAELKRIGVRTIISVDGARPDLENAEKHGLRYVHLPHGYDGISPLHARTLSKAVRELPGPIYVHCHHGKHRSPAAAMVACIGAGFVDLENGVSFLRLAGTSERYRGLYASVAEARPFEKGELASLHPTFPKVTDVPPLAKAMVRIEARFDNLVIAGRSNWKVNAAHPDIDVAHEALMLKEHFAEMLRAVPSGESSQAYREILQGSHDAASRMETRLNRRPLTANSLTQLSSDLTTLKTDCRRCHAHYRDRPANKFPLEVRNTKDRK